MSPRSGAESGWRWITAAIMPRDAALTRTRGHRHVSGRQARAAEAPARGGAPFAGAEVEQLPLHAPGFLPDLERVSEETWERAAIVWLNYPNNPTGAVAPLDFLLRAAELSREHSFLLACDEAYSELWFEAPPHSAPEVREHGNVVVFNTPSKRSSMTGYRSGFVAAEAE